MLYFDELKEGDVFITPGRTITEADVCMFAGLTGDYNQLHTNAEAMKNSQFGGRLVHGLLALSISHGLMFQLGILNGSAIAFAGIDDLTFLAPVMFNDTIHARITVSRLQPSRSKPDRGIAYFNFEIINQNDVVVQRCIKKIMMKKKPVE
ncbi:MAG: MaoC/PaaZ C-terminal domain-containing protein [Acetivibrionales bacterium]|jgi:acyl dehydratase